MNTFGVLRHKRLMPFIITGDVNPMVDSGVLYRNWVQGMRQYCVALHPFFAIK
jgi:hypothetical protein